MRQFPWRSTKGKGKDQKGKGQHKGKGQGSYGGFDNKGKDKQQKGKDGKGKDGKGKGNGISPDTCTLCGGRGHRSRECPMKALRQVSDATSSVTQTVNHSASTAQASTSATSTNHGKAVRRVETVILDDDEDEFAERSESSVRLVKAEAFDLTQA